MTATTIYTDGACVPNPGNGGWAFVVYRGGEKIHEAYGGATGVTNNAMELMGVLRALNWLRIPANRLGIAFIKCDSRYVVNGCNVWRHNWQRAGWTRNRTDGFRKGQMQKAAHNAAIANLEIWKEIAAALDTHPALPVEIEWVKGHAGIEGNERADELTMIGAAEAAGIPVAELYDMEARMRRREKNND